MSPFLNPFLEYITPRELTVWLTSPCPFYCWVTITQLGRNLNKTAALSLSNHLSFVETAHHKWFIILNRWGPKASLPCTLWNSISFLTLLNIVGSCSQLQKVNAPCVLWPGFLKGEIYLWSQVMTEAKKGSFMYRSLHLHPLFILIPS